jgi:hypothetical protein
LGKHWNDNRAGCPVHDGLERAFRSVPNDLGQLNPVQQKKVKRVGITTARDAGNIIDLAYRSKD